eukprot:jgi/Botrbrau1/14975/Bobra.0018s0075.1
MHFHFFKVRNRTPASSPAHNCCIRRAVVQVVVQVDAKWSCRTAHNLVGGRRWPRRMFQTEAPAWVVEALGAASTPLRLFLRKLLRIAPARFSWPELCRTEWADGQHLSTTDERIISLEERVQSLEVLIQGPSQDVQQAAFVCQPLDVASSEQDRVLGPSLDGATGSQATELRSAGKAKGKWSCIQCGARKTSDGARLRVCSACRLAFYCSKACQTCNWPLHKPDCIALCSLQAALQAGVLEGP